MNVLWLSHLVPYPPTGLGVLQRSYNLVRELAREHRVYLLAFIQRKLLKETLGEPEQGLKEAYDHWRPLCADVNFLPIPSDRHLHGQAMLAAKSVVTRDPYTINWMKSAEMSRVAQEWRERYRFDLVHFDIISLAPYHRIFADHPTTLDHHNIESHMMLRRAEQEPNLLKRAYFWQEGTRLARYEKAMCPRFNLHLTCSALDTQRLRELVPGVDAVEIPNGVDVQYFKSDGSDPAANSLIFAGNLSWYPNAAAMLYFAEKVWPLLREAVHGVTMHVVGANPPAPLQALASRDPSFKVHGFVPDVRVYLNQAAIYVCPIRDGGGTKLKVLDALAMGKALVADPIACEGIDVAEGQTVLFAREPQEYVRQIARLLGNEAERRRMGAAARLLAEESYSYAGIGRKLSQAMIRCHEAAHRSRQRVRA